MVNCKDITEILNFLCEKKIIKLKNLILYIYNISVNFFTIYCMFQHKEKDTLINYN